MMWSCEKEKDGSPKSEDLDPLLGGAGGGFVKRQKPQDKS